MYLRCNAQILNVHNATNITQHADIISFIATSCNYVRLQGIVLTYSLDLPVLALALSLCVLPLCLLMNAEVTRSFKPATDIRNYKQIELGQRGLSQTLQHSERRRYSLIHY